MIPTTIHVSFCPQCARPLVVSTPQEHASGTRCEDHPEARPQVGKFQRVRDGKRTGRKPRKARR